MGTTSSAIFNGNSRYSADFSAVIDRAVAIASIPITQLNNDKTSLTAQSTALQGLDSNFSALQSAVQGIGTALGGASLAAAVSDPTKLSVTLGDGAVEGDYSIDVISAGAYATSMTAAAWNGDGQHTYQISIGGVPQTLTTADNSAAGVAAAINSQYGDQVRATVVNVRTADNPDYRISLRTTKLDDLQPDILDNAGSVQTQQITGVQVHYVVNGSGQDVYSNSRSATVSTGVTLNLLASDAGTPVSVTVSRSSSALSNALSTLATAYNTAVDALDQQHGSTSGALAGNSVLNDLSQALRGIGTYSAPGNAVGTLKDLGLELDKNGHLTFDSTALSSANLANSSGIAAFLGSSTTSGFLKVASDSLAAIEQTDTGLLPSFEASVQSQISDNTNRTATLQAFVDQTKLQLQQQMAAADALIATMEQQYNYLSGMFQAMQASASQYK
jgi:flagellar hook-associated protein 2